MNRSRRSLAFVAAPLVALTIALAACGQSNGVKVALGPNLRGVVVGGKGAEAVRIDTSVRVSAAGAEATAPITASVTAPLGGSSGTAAGTVKVMGIEAELRIVGGNLYVGSAALPLPKKWLKVPAGDDLGQLGALAAQITDADRLTGFVKEAGQLEELGNEQIAGLTTTHYRATIDVAKAMKGSSLPASVTKGASDVLGDSFVADLWVDQQRVLRRVTYGIDLARLTRVPLGLPNTGELMVQLDLHDASAVAVQAPQSGDVVDASSLGGILGPLGDLASIFG